MSFADTLRALLDEGAVAWGLLLAAAIALVLTPLVARLAAAGIALPAVVLLDLDGALPGILLGLPLVLLVGLVDDVRGLGAGTKLLAVTLVALIPVLGWDMTFTRVTLPVIGDFDLGWLAVPLTLLWIALVTNLVNLIDGMDSLAAGIVAIASAAFAVLAMSFGRVEVAALAAMVCGATLGFLRHNYHPATIFMGDSGALTLGFVLGSLAVEGVLKSAATIALAAPLLIMAVPILDTSFVVAKRLKYKRRPWAPDQNHFYHRFLRIGYSQRRTAAYLHAWAAVLAGYAMLVRFVPPRPFGIWDLTNTLVVGGVGVLILAGSVWMVYELEILKARHLEALRFRRPPSPEEEPDEAVERLLEATPAGAGPPDRAA
jgi:UDP-GlcNAc:undecaprenyl-phosphate GlcNAc-1-phosphate transferase